MGLSSLADLQKNLQEELDIKKDAAQKLSQEINRFVFYPIKPALEQLYNIEIANKAEATRPASPEKESIETNETSEGGEKEEKKIEPAGGDTYRESSD